jgi:hypothetical protein
MYWQAEEEHCMLLWIDAGLTILYQFLAWMIVKITVSNSSLVLRQPPDVAGKLVRFWVVKV